MIKLLKKQKVLIIILLILIFIVFIALFKDEFLKIFYPTKYDEIVSNYAQEYNVDKNLIFAVIKAESNFNKNANSNKGAIGLMQLMDETAKDVANKNNIVLEKSNIKEQLLNEEININIGTKYLEILLKRYSNVEISLAAYNAGIGTVDNWIEKGIIKSDGTNIENVPYKETNNYIRKILRDYKIYEYLY